MNNSIELIRRLSDASGVSGFEDDVLKIVRSFEANKFSYTEDSLRNIYMTKRGSQKEEGGYYNHVRCPL